MTDANALIASYVTQMQRAHAQGTRGIATPEMRDVWRTEAVAVLDALKAEALQDAAEDLAELVDSQHPDALNPDQWLRDRADQITNERTDHA